MPQNFQCAYAYSCAGESCGRLSSYLIDVCGTGNSATGIIDRVGVVPTVLYPKKSGQVMAGVQEAYAVQGRRTDLVVAAAVRAAARRARAASSISSVFM